MGRRGRRESKGPKREAEHPLIGRNHFGGFGSLPHRIALDVPPVHRRADRLGRPDIQIHRAGLGDVRAEPAMQSATPYTEEHDHGCIPETCRFSIASDATRMQDLKPIRPEFR
jgi:hypothetical protein